MTQAVPTDAGGMGGRGRWIVLALAAIFLLLLAARIGYQLRQTVLDAQAIGAAGGEPDVNDFQRFHQRIRLLLSGQGTYLDDGFPLPPVTLLLLAPLTLHSSADAQLIWACCKPWLAMVVVAACLGMMKAAGVRVRLLPLALVLAAWAWPLMDDIQEGQMNLLMLAPLSLGLWAAQRGKPAGDWSAGLLVGLAACIKVTPILFLVYFLLRRRWHIVAAMLAALALFLVIIPAIGLGWARNMSLLGDWSRVMILPYVLHANVVYTWSQSVPSFLTRVLCRLPAWHEIWNGDACTYYVNVCSLPPSVVGWIIRSVLAIPALLGICWLRRPLATLRCPRYLGEIAAVSAFMLWASERTWFHHYVTGIFMLCAAAAVWSLPSVDKNARRAAAIALVAAVLLLALNSELAEVLGHRTAVYLRLTDLPLWSSILLVVSMVAAKLPEQTPQASRQT